METATATARARAKATTTTTTTMPSTTKRDDDTCRTQGRERRVVERDGHHGRWEVRERCQRLALARAHPRILRAGSEKGEAMRRRAARGCRRRRRRRRVRCGPGRMGAPAWALLQVPYVYSKHGQAPSCGCAGSAWRRTLQGRHVRQQVATRDFPLLLVQYDRQMYVDGARK